MFQFEFIASVGIMYFIIGICFGVCVVIDFRHYSSTKKLRTTDYALTSLSLFCTFTMIWPIMLIIVGIINFMDILKKRYESKAEKIEEPQPVLEEEPAVEEPPVEVPFHILCSNYYMEFSAAYRFHNVDHFLSTDPGKISSGITMDTIRFMGHMQLFKDEIVMKDPNDLLCLNAMADFETFLLRLKELVYIVYGCSFLKDNPKPQWFMLFDSPMGGPDTYDDIRKRQEELISLREKTKWRPKYCFPQQ